MVMKMKLVFPSKKRLTLPRVPCSQGCVGKKLLYSALHYWSAVIIFNVCYRFSPTAGELLQLLQLFPSTKYLKTCQFCLKLIYILNKHNVKHHHRVIPKGISAPKQHIKFKERKKDHFRQKKKENKKMRNTVADKMIFSLKHLIQLQGSL